MMRLEIRLSIRFGKEPATSPTETTETFESQGSLVEMHPQPRYVGFEAIE